MAKTKSQKRTEAKKNAETMKAKKKALRLSSTKSNALGNGKKKGSSIVGQSKKKK